MPIVHGRKHGRAWEGGKKILQGKGSEVNPEGAYFLLVPSLRKTKRGKFLGEKKKGGGRSDSHI